MLQISQICWQNLAVVFSGLWASTHVLCDEPSRAWQSSVLLAQLGTGCSLCPLSAPAFPLTRCLGQQHYFYVYNMQQGPHRSSQGLFCCPQPSAILCFAQSLPCLLVLFSLPLAACLGFQLTGTASQGKGTTGWVPWRRHQVLVKMVEPNGKWWGFSTSAQCIKRQILQGKILSVIYPEVRYSKPEYKLQHICFCQWVPASCWADNLFLEGKKLSIWSYHPILEYTVSF